MLYIGETWFYNFHGGHVKDNMQYVIPNDQGAT